MIIQHNLNAINAHRMIGIANKNIFQNAQRLSSGLRINTAADDATGLAISEKMRAQIRGLYKADGNIQDGINLIQTADGGMNEITNILIRQRELIIQGLNGTNTDDDKAKIQMEINQLTDEIDSIADRVEFNKIKLLKGSSIAVGTGTFEAAPSVIDLRKVSSVSFFEVTYEILTDGVYELRPDKIYEVIIPIEDLINRGSVNWIPPCYPDPSYADKTEEYVFSVDLTNNTVISRALSGAGLISLNNIAGVRLNGITGYDVTEAWADSIVYCTPGGNYLDTSLGTPDINDFPYYLMPESDTVLTWNFIARKEIVESTDNSNGMLWIQTGANDLQGMYIDLYDCRPLTLGIQSLSLSTNISATNSLNAVDAAIKKISDYRATCGAQQNRLEHSWRAANISAVNTEDAVSRISDADMAKEVTANTKTSVLMQAGMAMLAQAGQQQEMVLQLLR